MKKGFLALMAMTLLALPVTGFAAMHDMGHGSMEKGGMPAGSMDHGNMGMDHGGMQMTGDMAMLPEQTVDGVTALVHLKDVKAAMEKMGMKHTHHFMVMFKDEKGKPVEAQVAAVKIVDPAGNESDPVKLMAMQGHAGADIVLVTPGDYTFKLAAKLANGKKVQYEIKYTVK